MRRLATALLAWMLVAPALARSSAQSAVPSPEHFFGFAMGAEGRLATWDRMVEYFRVLARTTARVRVQELGRTTGGRPYLLVIVGTPDTLSRLDDVRARQHRLADPRETSEKDGLRLAREGKAVVVIGAGVHSTETGSSQMINELIWHLATDRSPATEHILRNVVVLLVPSQNPDGLQMTAEWHASNAGTPFEDAPLPELYHPYAGHDNNRDGFMQTQVETRLLSRVLYRDWLPEVYLDLHQMGPSRARIFVPPYRNPVNPNIDPLVWSEANVLGQTMAAHLQAAGKTGILWGETYTGYWQGANSTTPWWHNIIGMLSEVASARTASSVLQEPAHPAPGSLADRPASAGSAQLPPPADTQFRMNYPDPWLGGRWTPRDVVDYHLLATLGLLEGVANNREMLKRNFYRMHQRAIERFRTGRPFAFVIPSTQHDPAAAAHLVRLLRAGGAEVHRADSAFTVGDISVPAGSAVVLLAQPFGRWVKDVLEPQRYPDVRWPAPDGPAQRPYDVTGWTLGMQMGVTVQQIDAPFETRLARLTEDPSPRGRLIGDGHAFVIGRNSNADATLANRLLDAGATMVSLPQSRRLEGHDWPAGTFLARGVDRREVERAAAEVGVDVQGLDVWPEGEFTPVRAPRVAVVEPWGGVIDAGWTDWVLRQHGFHVTRVRPAALRTTPLNEQFDAIVVPEMSSMQLLRGWQSASVRPEHRGGLEDTGVLALKGFLRAGGTVVTLGNSAEFAIDYLDVPAVVAARSDDVDSTFIPGSLLRVRLEPSHPVTYGMPEDVDAMHTLNNGYTPGRGADELRAIARYADDGLLRSGYAIGENRLKGLLAAFEMPLGQGRVIVLGFRPQHRGQTWGTFKLLFNALFESTTRVRRGETLTVEN